ncbi:cysteine desulfurase, partial [Mycobacterium sp. CBMA361]|nr:cysteine desulfurase [Mycolicibacterium sp. CBMA 361]
MSTSDLPLSDAELSALASQLFATSFRPGPDLSDAELSALASQLFATSFRPGPDSPPVTTQVAPRGVAPDVTAPASAASTA